MANGKISGMTDGAAIAANDLLEISQFAAGPVYTTKSIKASYILTYVSLTLAPIASPSFTGVATVNANVTPTASLPATLSGTLFRLANSDTNPTRFMLDAWSSNGNITLRAAAGTAASPTALLSGATIGAVVGAGAMGAASYTGARVGYTFFTTENWSSTNNGCSITMSTTPNGSTTIRAILTIDQDGGIKPGADASFALGTSALRYAGVFSSAPIVMLATTVGSLPAAASWTNGIAIVTDAAAPTLGAVVSGGGAVRVIVNSDGTNWRVG